MDKTEQPQQPDEEDGGCGIPIRDTYSWQPMIGGEREVMGLSILQTLGGSYDRWCAGDPAYPEMSGKGHRSSAGDTPILMAAPVLDFV